MLGFRDRSCFSNYSSVRCSFGTLPTSYHRYMIINNFSLSKIVWVEMRSSLPPCVHCQLRQASQTRFQPVLPRYRRLALKAIDTFLELQQHREPDHLAKITLGVLHTMAYPRTRSARKGFFFRLQAYNRVRTSQVEVYERAFNLNISNRGTLWLYLVMLDVLPKYC